MKYLSTLVVFFAALSSCPAFAQGKYNVRSYRYETEEACEFELESYSYFAAPPPSNNVHSFNQQFEIEYGVTDRFQLGLHQVFGISRNSNAINFCTVIGIDL